MATSTTAIPTDEPKTTAPESQLSIVLRRFRKHRIAMFCVGLLGVMLLLSALAPLIAPFPRDQPNLKARFLTPFSVDPAGKLHIFGTDHLGRDSATRLLFASRVSLGTAVFSTLISSLIGIVLGMLAGFFGGWVDAIISRTLEVVATFPTLSLLLIVVSIFVGNEKNIPFPTILTKTISFLFAVSEREAKLVLMVNLILALFGWTTTCRLMRGMVLSVRENVYIDSARALGASNLRLLARHIFPNALPPMIVDFTLGINGTLVSESVLSFLGFGITDPTPTWGNMLGYAQSSMFQYPWMPLIPSLPILLASVAINYIGDGLRDALDPRQKI